MKRVLVGSGPLLLAAFLFGGPIGCANPDDGGVSGGSGGSHGTGGSPDQTGTGGSTPGIGGMIVTGMGGQGVGGSTTGTGGRGTGGSTPGTGGMTTDLMTVAMPINGALITAPCVRTVSASVCDTVPQGGTCPDTANADLPLRGIKTFDKTYTLGGARGTRYSITIHVQGEVEAKQYSGGTDQERVKVSPAADGWYAPTTGDTARVITGTYNVYTLRVTPPGGTKVDYFLNAIQPPGVQNHTTYGMDYVATFPAEGTSTVRLISSDSNCQMIANCGPTQNDGSQCPGPIIMMPDMSVRTANPTVDFTRAFPGQWIGITVMGVAVAP